jgi:hypothetical protein
MALSDSERELIASATKEQYERVAFKRDLRKRVTADNNRRAAIANKFRDELIRKGMAAAGIDYDAIRQRQAKEGASVRKELEKLRPEIKANAEKIAERHNRWRHNVLSNPAHVIRRRLPGDGETTVGAIPEASSTYIWNGVGTPNISVGPDGNIFRWYWETSSHNSDGYDGQVTGYFYFILTPETNGLLGAVAPITYNGSMEGYLKATCFSGGSVGLKTIGSLTIEQMLPENQNQLDGINVYGPGFYTEVSSQCLGGYYPRVFDQVQLLQTDMPLLVIANHPVVITVSVNLDASGDNSGILVDYMNDGRAVTVAGVLIGITRL